MQKNLKQIGVETSINEAMKKEPDLICIFDTDSKTYTGILKRCDETYVDTGSDKVYHKNDYKHS